MKMTLTQNPSALKKSTIFHIEIDDYETASVHLSGEDKALFDRWSDENVFISDRLVALAIIIRKIEKTVQPRIRPGHP